MTDQFATEIDLPAPAEEVFRHLTDPAAMIRWMGQHAVLKPVPGGAFEVDINGIPVRGQYLEIDPPRRVLVSWGVAGNAKMPPGATEVEFTLTPVRDGTRLRLVRRGLPPSQAQLHATGWQHFLPRLASAAAGIDPAPTPGSRQPLPDRKQATQLDPSWRHARQPARMPALRAAGQPRRGDQPGPRGSGPAALAAQVYLYRSAALAGVSQTARSGPLMKSTMRWPAACSTAKTTTCGLPGTGGWP